PRRFDAVTPPRSPPAALESITGSQWLASPPGFVPASRARTHSSRPRLESERCRLANRPAPPPRPPPTPPAPAPPPPPPPPPARDGPARVLQHLRDPPPDVGREVWREPVENYRSPERFAREVEAVLRCWPVPFCPSAALPEPGSYVAREAAGTPLVVVRGQDGRVRAFRNACRHRGNQLAEGSGCARSFACRYHGWTYRLDGALAHVPHEHGFPGLDKSAFGLVPLACEERLGLVFATQEPGAAGAASALEGLPTLVAP